MSTSFSRLFRCFGKGAAGAAGGRVVAGWKSGRNGETVAVAGHTPPAGAVARVFRGALGQVSRSGRFRNRASDSRPRTVRGSTLSRAEASGSGPAAACRSTDPGSAGFFVHRDRWLRGREDSVRPVLTGNSVKSFLQNIYTRRCSRTTARFRALPELCQRIRATSFSAKTSCYNLGAHRGAETMTLNFKSQDGPARNAGCGSRNGRGTSRCCGRGRSAAFTPLQRGQPFGVRCLLGVRESKRHKCRARISNFGMHGMAGGCASFHGRDKTAPE